MSRHSAEGSGRNSHVSIWKRATGRENRKCLKFGEGKSVTGVEWGIECWETGPQGDDEEPSLGASAVVRTLAYFRWEAIGWFWKQWYNILCVLKASLSLPCRDQSTEHKGRSRKTIWGLLQKFMFGGLNNNPLPNIHVLMHEICECYSMWQKRLCKCEVKDVEIWKWLWIIWVGPA